LIAVAVGQKYYPAQWHLNRSRRVTWRVVRLFNAPDGIAHAQLVADQDAAERRTVSCQALSDRRLYQRLETADA
jgi:hypothetical protein